MKNISIAAASCLALPLLVWSCAGSRVPAPAGVVPLSRAHAHNDYEHTRPLLDALDHGFTSVEADIHLVDGDLYVAHDADDIAPNRTLRLLYLDPLRRRTKLNAGSVYTDGPRFRLLIDIKTESVATYKALSNMLAEYEDIFTTFGPNGRRDKAVVAIVSGNRPRELMAEQKIRHAAYDGRLADLDSDATADFIPLISANWRSHFTWTGAGNMPDNERRKLNRIVEAAHVKNRRVRFWATPDGPSPERQNLWQELLRADVDMINTDHLEDLEKFLLARTR